MGNLTWWTTDQDIQDGVVNLGVSDFIEVSKNTVLIKTFEPRCIGNDLFFTHEKFSVLQHRCKFYLTQVKFYENRANGQSKGFCCVSLGRWGCELKRRNEVCDYNLNSSARPA